MVTSWLGFLLLYSMISAVPGLVLVARGRGWRPRFFALSFLVAWTGGGWVIMLWLAVAERSSNFTRNVPPPAPRGQTRQRRT